jgi:diadenosine tetraphosphate (Ap4A) HIT family hydrolase
MACPFCTKLEIRERLIVAEDKLAWAFPTNIPIVPGHTLIVPTRCVASFAEMTDEERAAIFRLMARIQAALRTTVGATGFNIAWNDGEIAGQSVPHFHLHIVPRYAGDTGITEYEPRKFLYRPGNRAESPEEELRQMAERLRACL